MPDAPPANRLARETSPYLLQHAHNPVDWYPWGEEAFERARCEGKPILLSVGYSACHWCHVMERESFENPDIAAAMNADFVNVKVDREERPDVDQVYMGAVQLMTGQGGWPMTVFLTPEGRPFYAGTYFPPEDRQGRSGFPRVLEAVTTAWRDRRAELEEQAGTLLEHVRQAVSAAPAGSEEEVGAGDLSRAFDRLAESFDDRLGGFGGAPKFPQPMVLDFLLRYAARTGRSEALRMVTLTLDQMACGGIYDHLGGGFHRYSTDRYWLVPHFEKMLYDNALLARTYLHAWQAVGEPRYRQVVEETLDFVRREMTDPAGGFYSTLDADSEGREGAFYVWKAADVEHVLGTEDAALFRRAYDVTPRGNWEGANILNVAVPAETLARSLEADPADVEGRLAKMRQALLAVREERLRPGRDDKVITAWNGLMLAAFADAAAVLGRADYLQTAANNAEFLLRELRQDHTVMRTGKNVPEEAPEGMDHRRHHSSPFRAAPIPGYLEDYACLADGLLRLYEASGETRWLDEALGVAGEMRGRFSDGDGGFFAVEQETGAAPPVRPRDLMDNATPSGTSVAVGVMLRLAVLTGDEGWRAAAEPAIRQTREGMAQYPTAFGRLLCAADFLLGPVQEVAIVGRRDDGITAALLAAARADYRPNLVLAACEPGDPAAQRIPLLAGKQEVNGRPAAYVCQNYACRRPTTDPAELRRLLSE